MIPNFIQRLPWPKMPAMRALLPLVLGMILNQNLRFWSFSLWLLALGLASLPLFIAIRRPKTWKRHLAFYNHLQALLWLLLGYGLHALSDPRQQPDFPSDWENGPVLQAQIKLLDNPQVQGKRLRCQAQLTYYALEAEQPPAASRLKLLVLLPLDTQTVRLRAGDWLQVQGQVQGIPPAKVPEGFNPQTFYGKKGIFHQIWVEHWDSLGHQSPPLAEQLEATRLGLKNLLLPHLPSSNEQALALALLLGIRQDMDKSLVQAYMDTGSMHVLAVSGLHVSMLAVIVQSLLALGGRGLRKGSWWAFGLANLGIWFFALLAGASASVLRAAVMFSLQQLGQQVQRQSNSYNTLALSGMILLCYQPQFLWDLGFLLSFLAVWGILYWYKPIYNLVFFQNKYLDWLWQMTAVSLAAQMATLPLCLYFFHQFPLLFWLAGWLILPLLTVLMPLALLVLVLGSLPYLGDLLGMLLYWGLWLMNAATLGVQAIPYSVINRLWFSAWSMGFLALAVVAFSFWLLLKEERRRWFMMGLGCLFLFNLSHGLVRWQAAGQRVLVLLHHPKGLHLDLVQGRHCLSLSDSLVLVDSNRIAQQQKNYLAAWQVEEQQWQLWPQDKGLIWGEAWLAGPLLHWGGQRILFYQAAFGQEDWQAPIKQVDVLVIKDAWRLESLNPILDRLTVGQVVLHPSNPRRKRQQWILEAEQRGIRCWDMQSEGSWILSE